MDLNNYELDFQYRQKRMKMVIETFFSVSIIERKKTENARVLK